MSDMLAGRFDVKNQVFGVERVPIPEPGPGQVRIKVEAAGVCLSDLHIIDGTLTPQYLDGDTVTLGHEVAGTVDALGPDAGDWEPGQRVLLQAGEEDRTGRVYTRGVDYDGGWAEYALATEHTLVAIPPDLPFEQACIIPDAVSTPWAAVTSTARTRPGDTVGVWGVGGLGAHAVQLLRLVGAAPVVAVDPLEAARTRALNFGADAVIDPSAPDFAEQMREATGGLGLDVAFDMAGVPSVREQAVGVLGRQGRLVLVGLTDQPITITNGTRFSYLQQQLLGHYGSEPEHVQQLVDLVARNRLDFAASVSDVLPLAKADQAIERLQSRQDNPIRLVLRP